MLSAYIAVTAVAAIAYAYAAFLSLTRDRSVVQTAERLGVPVSWMPRLGSLLGAGAIGLVIGFAVPALGIAAGYGLVLYFVCAALAHIRARDSLLSAWVNWFGFFALAVAVLVVGLAYHGAV